MEQYMKGSCFWMDFKSARLVMFLRFTVFLGLDALTNPRDDADLLRLGRDCFVTAFADHMLPFYGRLDYIVVGSVLESRLTLEYLTRTAAYTRPASKLPRDTDETDRLRRESFLKR